MPGTDPNQVSNQGNPQPGQAAGNPNPSQPAEQDAELNQPVSRAEVLRLMQEQERRTQSLVDKNISRVDERVNKSVSEFNASLDRLKATGLQVTPEQEANMRRQAIEKAFDTIAAPQVAPQQAAQPAQDEATLRNYVNQVSAALLEDIGVEVNDDDPEAKLVSHASPGEFIKTLKEAGLKKKERLETSPQARIPSMGAGENPSLQSDYNKRKAALQGNVEGLFDLKMEFRKKGLNV